MTPIDNEERSYVWSLVYTKPNQEVRALFNLERQGFKCFMPICKIESIKQGKPHFIEEPLFPRYIFILLIQSDVGSNWSSIRSTLGVIKLVTFGGLPVKVMPEIVSMLRQRKEILLDRFHSGEEIHLIEGPLKGLEAIFMERKGLTRSMILINMLGRNISIEVDNQWIH